ncbi:MAG TPA: FAD-dependent monooxygenase [Xanthobacteraceae bacterium]
MAAARTIVIAGAGIGGLTAALALTARGFRAHVLDQAERPEETGAGLQLAPNATRVLLALGLGARLQPVAVAPQAIVIRRAASGSEIVSIPLAEAPARYGAPYWVVHRGDLHSALIEAARARDVSFDLGARVEGFAIHAAGITVKATRGGAAVNVDGSALVGADGLGSAVREELGDRRPPCFARRVAWRTLVPSEMAPPAARAPAVQLWLGPGAHLVHYPVAGGRLINVVAIAEDAWHGAGWSTASAPAEVLARFSLGRWSRHARDLLGMPERWLKWALHDRPALGNWGAGPVTLLGDAAHPMLPFLAQGAAMAIEDAAVLANALAAHRDNVPQALRRYERQRQPRTARLQRSARRLGALYHWRGPMADARNLALRALGGERLRARYDWIYDWRPA